MKRWSSLVLAFAVTGSVLAGVSMAADRPDNPPPPPREDGGGPGGPGGDRPGRGGPGGPPGGVHVIPRFAEEKLNLTDEQRKQIADLEKVMKEKLAKILTPEHLKTLEQSRPPRRPGGQGGPDGGGPRGGGQGGSDAGPGRPGGGEGGGQGGRGGAPGDGARPQRQR
jgi:translation initiation factor IF-2